MPKKKATIDDLAIAVKSGFDDVDKQFKNTGKQLKGLQEGQERIELRLNNVAYWKSKQDCPATIQLLFIL